jgi:hypothetical protein
MRSLFVSSFSRFVLIFGLLAVVPGGSGVVALAGEGSDTGEGQLIGKYEISGVNRDESTFKGTLTIEQQASHRLYMLWEDDDSRYEGQGAVVGSSLFAVWGSAEAQCFVVFFEVTDNGMLDGFWFRAMDRGLSRGTERAVPVGDASAGEISAAYSVEGIAPDGSQYNRELRVNLLEEDFYRFQWSGESALEGIGQLDKGSFQVIASFVGHEGQCGKTEFERDKDGVLHGIWRMNDDNYKTVGTTTAVPIR